MWFCSIQAKYDKLICHVLLIITLLLIIYLPMDITQIC